MNRQSISILKDIFSNILKVIKPGIAILILPFSLILLSCNNLNEPPYYTEIYSPKLSSKGVFKSDLFIMFHHKYDTVSNNTINYFDLDSIPYTEFEGKKVFQGDIILSNSYNEMADSIKLMIAEIQRFNKLAPFAYIPKEKRDQHRKYLLAVGEKAYSKLWTQNDNVIPYLITSSVDENNVRAAIKLWQDKLEGVIKFEEIKSKKPANYVVFIYGDGYSSEIGMLGGPQSITIASGNEVGNIAHEIGHLLGLWHEHSHPERDEFILIQDKNIASAYLSQFMLKDKNEVQTNKYDFNSIMHYTKSAFSKNENPNLITIEVKEKYKAESKNMGQRQAPSQRDILMIRELYKN